MEGVKDLKSYSLDLDTGAGQVWINEERQGFEFKWTVKTEGGAIDRYIDIDNSTGDIKIEED